MDNLDKLTVPNEMRELAGKSVDQARTAVDRFLSVARSNFDKMGDASESTHSSVKNLTSQSFEYMEQNINAAFDLAKHLVNAKDIHEATKLQAEYIRKQFGAMQAQAKTMNVNNSDAV